MIVNERLNLAMKTDVSILYLVDNKTETCTGRTRGICELLLGISRHGFVKVRVCLPSDRYVKFRHQGFSVVVQEARLEKWSLE